MINLTSTSDAIRVITSAAAQVEVHASWVDFNGTAVTPGRLNSPAITTATTTTVVASPGSGVQRNLKHLNITNDHATVSCVVSVEHTDGTNIIELMAFTLLPGENMIFGEDGHWSHRAANGSEYPPAGLGAYNGYTTGFFKLGTPSDAVGYWYSTYKDTGFPGAWSPGAPGVNGRITDGTAAADDGCIRIPNPTTGVNFLTELTCSQSTVHHNLFFDVLWVNTGLVVTTTTLQAIASPALPARDIAGGTNGDGCMIGMIFTAASTVAAAVNNSTITYTNSRGTAGRTATLVSGVGMNIPATPVIGTLVWFSLQAGDFGVQSIQGITLNTSLLTGTISLIIARPVASIGTTIVNIPAMKPISAPGARLYNSACLLHGYRSSSTTATTTHAELTVQEK